MSPRAIVPVLSAVTLLTGCWSPSTSRDSADEQVYGILAKVTEQVTGAPTTHKLDRPIDTLRNRLLNSKEPVHLDLFQALDVAAENSREFQRQKESLYLAALSLTREQHNFALRFSDVASGEVSGQADDTADADLSNNLSASVNTVAGTRIVASFFNTFMRSLIHGGRFDGGSILNLTLTQPLLSGAGQRIVREPLTQAEREVVYSVRDFERFRADFSISVVSEYWNVVRQMTDLVNVEANYRSLSTSREQIEELYKAGRKTVTDLGRAKQSEYSADVSRVEAKNRLESAMDRFKLTLGLPINAQVELDPDELKRLTALGVENIDLEESTAVALALQRRYDFQTVVDSVEDAGRRILVSEDALDMSLDFTAALNVPSESGKDLNLDWSRVNWSAGFELDLALDKLVERNAYRSALISFDLAVRNREQSEDQITADVRSSLRNIQSAIDTYRIQTMAVQLAEQRVEANTDLYAAGRVEAFEKLDAQDALISAQLQLTAAIVDYHVAKLQLMNDLEAIDLEHEGLRFDPALPMPQLKTGE
ncbi:MAG: TolC family protein [Planctomycetes bacterium]|nr:TolC family protein [Planctomycetota bacterium]MCB9885580.1 TolC family protein [Planctomycetota bacterium]